MKAWTRYVMAWWVWFLGPARTDLPEHRGPWRDAWGLVWTREPMLSDFKRRSRPEGTDS